ncbi:MAG: TetR/AcrR family transcriptional regulator [Oscillospiraceae bacterium]|nr:TetR/AcrR family transcriptional regulator [Oscillospiraceae bacterium]
MYKQCQTARSAARQRELEQGLLQIMQKKRYEDISVSDLCVELGVPRKSFYRYFSGKDGALYSLIDHALMDYDGFDIYREQAQENQPLYYMEQVLLYWVGQRQLLDTLEKSNLSGMLIQRAMAYSKNIDTIPRFMQITDPQLREYGTMVTVCGLMTMIVRWHHDGFTKDPKEMAQLALRLFTQPLFSMRWEDL